MTNEYQKGLKDGKYRNPGQVLADAQAPDHYVKMCEWVWGRYLSDELLFGANAAMNFWESKRTIYDLRAYARDNQPVSKYQRILDPRGNESLQEMDRDEGLMNISWDPPKVMSKFMNIIMGMFGDITFDVDTQAVDESARKERDILKAKQQLFINPKMKALMAATGTKPDFNSEIPGVETEQDVDLLHKLGGVRLAYEIMMKAAVRATMEHSEWETSLHEQLKRDLVTLNICATRSFIHPTTRIVETERVDPANLIIEPSQYPDFRDSTYRGIRRKISLWQLREESGLDEKTMYMIAKRVKADSQGKLAQNIPFTSRSYRDEHFATHGTHLYDDWKVEVLDICFIGATEQDYVVGRHHRTGGRIFDPKDSDKPLSKRDTERRKKSVMTARTNKVFKASWVIGTKVVYNYGEEYGIVKAGEAGMKKPDLPIHVFGVAGPSIVESCIPHLDDICLATYRSRDTLAKMIPPPGIAVDLAKTALEYTLSGRKYSIADLMGLASRSGVLFYESIPEYPGANQMSSGRNPIEPIQDKVMEHLAIFNNEVVKSIDLIRQVTGVNEVSDGSASPDMLVGVVKGLQAATNNALRPIFRAYMNFSKLCVRHWIRKWQLSILNGDIDIKYTPIGGELYEMTKLDKRIMDHEFGVMVKLMPNDQEKQMMIQILNDNRVNGLISLEDFFQLKKMIDAGQLDMAQLYASKAVADQEARRQRMEIEKMQQNARAQMEAGQAVEQAKQATIQLQTQGKIAVEEAIGRVQADLERLKASLKMENTSAEMGAKIALDQNK